MRVIVRELDGTLYIYHIARPRSIGVRGAGGQDGLEWVEGMGVWLVRQGLAGSGWGGAAQGSDLLPCFLFYSAQTNNNENPIPPS